MSFRPDEYVRATTVRQVTDILEQHGESAVILAGGTELHELIAKGMIPQAKKLIDVSELDLSYIREDDQTVKIGSVTKLCDVRDAPIFNSNVAYSALRDAADILPLQIVEVGTIGGNICAGLPILNFPPVTVAVGANLKATGPQGERIIRAEDFFLDYFLTALSPSEFLTEIQIPKFPDRTATIFKSHKILSVDYSTVSTAVRVTLDRKDKCSEVGIVFGSVGRIPMRARKAEDKLRGSDLSQKYIDAALDTIPKNIEPISDLRATANYRKEVSRVLAEEALNKAKKIILG